MPYTVPHTIAAAELVTTTTMNDEWGGNVAFLANPPACRVRHNANQALSAATPLALAFNTEQVDTAAMHDTVTANSRITFTAAGLYVVGGSATFDVSATGDRTLTIRKGGATVIAEVDLPANAVAARGTGVVIPTLYKFAAAEYIELVAQSSVALNLLTLGEYSPVFWAVWVGLG